MKRILLVLFVGLVTVAPAPTTAQTHTRSRTAPAPAERPKADPVDIAKTFVVATQRERWSLEDRMPVDAVAFAGASLSLEERMVNISQSPDGMKQFLFPVSWFDKYQDSTPEIKYVVVKYKDGVACSIMAEYLPNRMAMPKADFQPYPDGRGYYSDVAVVRQGGHVYYKQVTSQGNADGKGGLYVDMLLMYCVEDKSAGPK